MRWLLCALCILAPLVSQAAEPELSVSVNNSAMAKVFRGWPLLMQVAISNPSETETLVLAPRDLTWPRALHISATDPGGKAIDLPFELSAEPPSPAVTLPAGAETYFFMILPENATNALAAGKYRLNVAFAIQDSSGWKGQVQTLTTVQVLGKEAPTDDQQLEVTLLRATVPLLHKQPVAAKEILRVYLGKHPTVIPALRMMAEVLEAEGDPERAYLYADRAVELYVEQQSAQPDHSEPPKQLIELRRRLWHKLLAASPYQPTDTPAPSGESASDASPPVTTPATKPGSAPAAGSSAPAPETPAGPAQSTTATPPGSAATTPATPSGSAPTNPVKDDNSAKQAALDNYNQTMQKADALFAAGNYHEAVRAYEHVWRIAYQNKLKTDSAILDEKLARARKARDEQKKQ